MMALRLLIVAVGFLVGFSPVCSEEIGREVIEDTSETNLYADCGVILDEPTEYVDVVFQNGQVFRFENEDGDWLVGDLVALMFDDNGTEIISDDIIIGNPRYSGWISESEMKNWIK